MKARLTLAAILAILLPQIAAAQHLRIRDICRVKGQEENTLHGLGLVVGLNGTGDSETPTMRALAKMLELMGNPVGQQATGEWNLDELANSKNVAMVFVSATIPAGGVRQGDTITCEVNAVSAQSLKGGYLMMTPLVGPRRDNPGVYAFCHGPIFVEQRAPETTGRIHRGCRLEKDVRNEFVQDGKITLVLDSSHASFQTADILEEHLEDYVRKLVDEQGLVTNASTTPAGDPPFGAEGFVRAIDQVNIEVAIISSYQSDPVSFAAELLDIQFVAPRIDARVFINKRNGTIIVGENVVVGKVAVSHNNISVQTGGGGAGGGPLQIVDPSGTTTTRLEALVDALNSLKVGTDDIISIVEGLHENRALYGHLIVQ